MIHQVPYGGVVLPWRRSAVSECISSYNVLFFSGVNIIIEDLPMAVSTTEQVNVTYKQATSEQISALKQYAANYCYQPIKVSCQNTQVKLGTRSCHGDFVDVFNGQIHSEMIAIFTQLYINLTPKVLVATIDAQWEGMGDVGSVRYEPALLPPCPTIRVLSYSN